jgi:hypothetical protein
MADKEPALFRRVFGSLRPVTPAAERLLESVPDRAVRVEIKNIRGNTRRLGLYWVCLRVGSANVPARGSVLFPAWQANPHPRQGEVDRVECQTNTASDIIAESSSSSTHDAAGRRFRRSLGTADRRARRG